jgi:arsenate-mycothiol transferase
MAAALMRQIAGDRVEVYSAGTNPDEQVHDLSAQAVAEIGADMTGQQPQRVDTGLVARVDRVIVLGSEAKIAAPAGMKGALHTWIIPDPAERGIDGIERVRIMRDDIRARVQTLAGELIGGPGPQSPARDGADP